MKTSWLSRMRFMLLSLYKSALQDQRMDSFISGIYEREYKYGTILSKDILTIRRLSEVTDLFEVERRIVRGAIEEGAGLDKLCQSEKWIAAYHVPTHQLVQGVSHKICSFSPERDLLFFENKEYWKTDQLVFDAALW